MIYRLAAAVVGAFAVGAAPAAAAVPSPPMQLPGAASASVAQSWIVGARPGGAAARIARTHGATAIGARSWEIPRSRARELAAALDRRGLLVFAEPDRAARTTQGPAPDPLSPQAAWRDAIVRGNVAPPPVTPRSPLLAVIDSRVDLTHPEWVGGNVRARSPQTVTDFHGTATTAVAAAPANGVGILGVWPGMRAINLPLPSDIRCSDSARQIRRAVRERAAVINMSYGAPTACFAEYEELQKAVARGVSLVAAAGNEFAAGNDPQYPASLPHVVTVAAVGADLRSSFFSNANAAVDVSAPGEGILTAVPAGDDPDEQPDGYAALDGTSFSAPMVAAAIAWVRAARPALTPDQAEQVVRLSAEDIDREGYDTNTGFGLLRVDQALTREPPLRDPGEPNEDIRWIDGSRLPRAATPLYRTGRSAKVRAIADELEDPRDVYRVTLPARSRLSIKLKPDFGDVDLTVHSRSASTVTSRRGRIAASSRDGTRTDSVTVRNDSRSSRTVWVGVAIDDAARSLDSTYTLTVTRR